MLSIKNNIIWPKSKKYTERFSPVIFNQLIVNAISIIAMAVIFAVVYLMLPADNLDFSVIEIYQNQKVYIDKKSVQNYNKLENLLKGKSKILFKAHDKAKYNLFCKIYNKVKMLGFRNIIFTKN